MVQAGTDKGTRIKTEANAELRRRPARESQLPVGIPISQLIKLSPPLSIIIIPRSWIENPYPALLRSINKAMATLGMEPGNVYIIIGRTEGGYVDKLALRRRQSPVVASMFSIRAVYCSDRMRRAVATLWGIFSHSIP